MTVKGLRLGRLEAVSLFLCALLLACLLPARAQTQGPLPHLRKQGEATQLVVDGKPFLVLGGEPGNQRIKLYRYR